MKWTKIVCTLAFIAVSCIVSEAAWRQRVRINEIGLSDGTWVKTTNLVDKSAATTFASALTFEGHNINAVGTQSLTNNATVAVAKNCYVVSGIGSANNATNTITLPNPGTAGKWLCLMLSSTTTNLIQLKETDANLVLNGDFVGDNGSVIELRAPTTNLWYEVNRVTNN